MASRDKDGGGGASGGGSKGIKKSEGKRKRDRPSANLSPAVDLAIQQFLKSKAASKLGIKSRDEFIKKAAIAVLIKYRKDYEALSNLFALDEELIKTADEGRLQHDSG